MSTVYLLDPSSTLATHIVTKTGSKMNIGNQSLPSAPNAGGDIVLNVQGPTSTNNVSAFQIPADTSNNRPTTNYAGYIRYNTDSYSVEYWNTLTSSWLPISAQPPIISNVTPSFVNQDSSFNSYTITGSFFNTSSFVSFTGVNNDVVYGTSGGTGFVNTNTLIATATYAMSDTSSVNFDGFIVKVTNTDSGLIATYATPLAFNTGPIWQTPSNTNLGTGYFDQSFTIINTPYALIDASDNHPPISYYYTTPPAGATLVVLDASSGKLKGTNPSYSGTGTSSTFTFSAKAQDNLGAHSIIRQFAFTVSIPLLTSSIAFTQGFVDVNGKNYTSTPYSTGYTVYCFSTVATGTITIPSNFLPYISYIVVGGGGGGGAGDSGGSAAGGGGAGGFLNGVLAATSGTSTITIGGGGAGGTGTSNGTTGSNSVFSTITANGGGGGGHNFTAGNSGGSGGGGGLRNNQLGGAVSVVTNPPQGNPGGYALFTNTGAQGRGGGGGSALSVGINGAGNNAGGYNSTSTTGGTGGQGVPILLNIGSPAPTSYSGGGGAGSYDRPAGQTTGLVGGGGAGGNSNSGSSIVNGGTGTANTGGGGGGGSGSSSTSAAGGNGGSGFIMLWHLTIKPASSNVVNLYTITGSATNYAISYVNSANTVVGSATPGGYTIITFNAGVTQTQLIPNSGSSTYRAQITTTQTFTFTPGTGNLGANCAYLIVGGGGSGGCRFGGGGGAGGVNYGYFSLDQGVTYTISVGAGGNAQGTNQQPGIAGTASSITGTVSPIISYGGGPGSCEDTAGAAGTYGSGGGASYALATFSTVGLGTPGQGFNGGYGQNASTRNCGGGGGAGGPGGTGFGTYSGASPETQLDSYNWGTGQAAYGGQAVGLAITGVLQAYGGGGGGCDNRSDSGASTGYGGGGGIEYTGSSAGSNGYPAGTYSGSGLYYTGGTYMSGGRGGGMNGNAIQGASGSALNSSGVGQAGFNGTGGGGGGGAYVTVDTYSTSPNPLANGQPSGSGGSGVVILRFPSYAS